MSDQLPAPDFNSHQYARPNDQWICGHAAEGRCCRIGPDSSGRCRATFECRPVLDKKEGDAKGRWRCTRPDEAGGKCEFGPLPDGTCCKAIPKCQPVRSLRSRRKVFTIAVVSFTFAFLLIALYGPTRAKFINPGELSTEHSTEAFARMHRGERGTGQDCAACHSAAAGGPAHWMSVAWRADPSPPQVGKLFVTTNNFEMTAIDNNCEQCHKGHDFHQPNVLHGYSCSACHREHLGSGKIRPPEDSNCNSCHANLSMLQASALKGKELAPDVFDYRPSNGRILFKAPRPEHGYTKVIHAFATDHPEFQVLADHLPDPNTLRFNHQLHLTSANVPMLNGKKITCADCHKPDATGVFYQPVSYRQNCQVCHSLQFDEKNPDLALPHGNPEFARAFLRSLPAVYAEYARGKKGLIRQGDIEDFVKKQIRSLKDRVQSGEALEQQIFFSNGRNGIVEKVGGQDALVRARFPGCSYCHEVKPGVGNDAMPVVTTPVMINRWLIRGRFDHSKHANTDCIQCHAAAASHETSDVILPSKNKCMECHSPKGGVANNCSNCHNYHAPGLAPAITASLK